jgi:hypothetical protein
MIHELLVDARAVLDERGQARAAWDLVETPPTVLCSGLCLLKEQLVERVIFRAEQGSWVVRLGRADGAREVLFSKYAPRRLEIQLGETELERWLVFFLKYFRDGVAEVDHLDVEGTLASGQRFDLVLKVACAAPPVSADEARRRLFGDPDGDLDRE